MFYNQDYLLSKKVGLRIVWLASTLGSANASAFRKLSKREIAAVDVQKTCEAVASPSQPLALRTSSHLMYGVVRVYTKQTEYWINDVQASYSSIRKLVLQTPHGAITTLGGIVLVGQDTSTIDMPSRSRVDAVTLPAQPDLFRNNLFLDSDWLEAGEEGGPEWQPVSDSLSMFGSSVYGLSSERGRNGSVDLGLGILTPRNQPYTADPSAIMRVENSPLHRNLDFEAFDLEHLDLSRAHEEGVQLDLGLDTELTAQADTGLDVPLLDDQAGFDLRPEDEDEITGDWRGRPSSLQLEDGRQSKRARLAIQDRKLELSDAQIRLHRENYVERMNKMHAQEALRRMNKDAERNARALIYGPTIDLAGAPMLAHFWTMGMTSRLAKIEKEAAMQAPGDGLSAAEGLGGPPQAGKTGPLPFDDGGEMPFYGNETGMETGGIDDQPRASTPFWEAEIGRAGLSSEPLEMPWNRTMLEQAGEETLAGETTMGVSTRSFSIETPTGLRRPGRLSSMSAISLERRPTTSIGGGNDRTAIAGAEEGPYTSDSQAFAEQDMLHFFNYAVQVRNRLEGEQPLFFSDLAPVADSSPAIAARAFQHILSLATAHRMAVKQPQAYGEIEIQLQ